MSRRLVVIGCGGATALAGVVAILIAWGVGKMAPDDTHPAAGPAPVAAQAPQTGRGKDGEADSGLSPPVLARVKGATVYVRVLGAAGDASSGSGFFAVGPSLVVTNAHVLDMLAPDAPPPPRVQLVLNGGEAGEQTLSARIVTVDRDSDLALLRAENPDGLSLPAPLDVVPARDLALTQKVYVFGFPLGEQLGKNITVSTSSVSSLRTDAAGRLMRVQVNGGMDPGNSGGPVVDTRGRVVGVAVAKIRDTQIDFAIPGEAVAAVAEGRLMEATVGEAHSQGDRPSVRVSLTALDPRGALKGVGVEWWLGEPGPERPPVEGGSAHRAGDGELRFLASSYDPAAGKGEVELPLTAPPAGKVVWLQPRWRGADGREHRLAARPYFPLPAVEARPVTLTFRPEAGKAVVDLRSQVALRLHRSDGTNHSSGHEFNTELKETVSAPDEKGQTAVSLRVGGRLQMSDSFDDEEAAVNPWLGSHARSSNTLRLGFALDGQGNLVNRQAEPLIGSIPTRAALQLFGDRVLDAVEFLAVPVPGGEVHPGQSWRATRPLPVSGRRHGAAPTFDVTYTYRGARRRGGQDFAVIDMAGELRGAHDQGSKFEGRVRGEATLDLRGRLLRATAVAEVSLDLFLRDESVHATGRVETSLTRRLTGVAAPVQPDPPPPNPLRGTWALTGTDFNGKGKEVSGLRATITDDFISASPANHWHYRVVGAAGDSGRLEVVNESEFTDPPPVHPAIYAVEGDTLKICVSWRADRWPTEFATFPDSGLHVLTFRRAALAGQPIKLLPGRPEGLDPPVPPRPPDVKLPDRKPAATGPQPRKVRDFVGHDLPVRDAVFASDGKTLVTTDGSKTIRVWDVAQGKQLGVIEKKNNWVGRLALSPDGKTLIAVGGYADDTGRRVTVDLSVWDLEKPRETHHLTGHRMMIRDLAVSSDGKRLLSGSNDRTVRLWDLEAGQPLAVLEGHPGMVCSVAFTPDGKKALSAGADVVVLWDLESRKEVRSFTKHPVAFVAALPDGKRALTGCHDGTLRLWDLATGNELKKFQAIAGEIQHMQVAADGKRVLCSGTGGVMVLWDIEKGKELCRFEHPDGYGATVLAPDGRHVLSCMENKTVRLLELP